MYERYNCPLIKTVEFYVLAGTKHTELSTTFTVTEFAKTHLQQSRLQKKFLSSLPPVTGPLYFLCQIYAHAWPPNVNLGPP